MKEHKDDFLIRNLSESEKRMEDIYPSINGIIYVKGKFKDQKRFVPYFFNLHLEGWSSQSKKNKNIFRISVSSEDIDLFPELKGTKIIELEIKKNSIRLI